MSNVLVITTSLRAKSNSDILAEHLIAGAKDAGHMVEHISLKKKTVKFCVGCLACQKKQKCVLGDDAVEIAEKVKKADTLVFATPIYYYGMSGQMKTLLDRMNPLYTADYKFRNVYLLTTATEDETTTPEKAVIGLQGWVDCFANAELVDSLFCGGISDMGEAEKKDTEKEEGYNFGRGLK